MPQERNPVPNPPTPDPLTQNPPTPDPLTQSPPTPQTLTPGSPPTPAAIDTVTRFALALDREDYAEAIALLDARCVYTIRGETIVGPDAIIDSYRGNGDTAAQVFDEITYGSEVIAAGNSPTNDSPTNNNATNAGTPGKDAASDGRAVIRFFDRITHAGQRLEHVCEQWVGVNEGKLITIKHHDLPGQREQLAAFKATHGL